MAYASRAGKQHASIPPRSATAVCDRCGQWWPHSSLQFQFEWAGSSLYNTQLLVCPPCLDIPQEQNRSLVIPADPLPTINPRIEYFVQDEVNFRTTYSTPLTDPTTGLPIPQGQTRATQDITVLRSTQATGESPGGLNHAPGTNIQVPDDIGGNDPGLPLEYTEVPLTGPLTGGN